MRSPAYSRPQTLAEMIEAMSSSAEARPIAGGTDLMNQMRLGLRAPDLVVDTAEVGDLHELDPGDQPVMGAAVTFLTLLSDASLCARYPALAEAARLLGGRQIQAMATVGGNVCNASPAAESATPLLVYEATALLEGPDGRREVTMPELWRGPGETCLAPGEVLVALRLGDREPGHRSTYRRMELRGSVDIAIVSAAASVRVSDDEVNQARVAIGAAAPVPLRVPEAEERLVGIRPSESGPVPSDEARSRIASAAAACREASKPIDDTRASAGYRGAMVEVIVERALRAALDGGSR